MPAASVALVEKFRALHRKGAAFLLPNFWDAGSAKILQGLGFEAIASTSAGFAMTMGRADYGVTRDEAMTHAREVCATVEIPVAADLENGFGAAPDECAETIRQAVANGLCGGSIEDTTGDARNPVHESGAAIDRIRAASEAARTAPNGFILTARAEAFLYGDADLNEVITRLQAFEEAGADVLFAPGLRSMEMVATVCASVSKPVNVLVMGTLANHSVEDFAEAGVARLSLGSGLANAAYATLVDAASSIQGAGRFGVLAERRDAIRTIRKLFGE